MTKSDLSNAYDAIKTIIGPLLLGVFTYGTTQIVDLKEKITTLTVQTAVLQTTVSSLTEQMKMVLSHQQERNVK
jgi:hypothetical protein